jgi:hypothetical protein
MIGGGTESLVGHTSRLLANCEGWTHSLIPGLAPVVTVPALRVPRR